MWAAVICLLTCSVISTTAHESPGGDIVPVYRIDLKSVLKADAVPTLGTHETPWVPVITLHFLDNDRLAATFVVPAKTVPRLATRDQEDAASPFRVRSAVIDASIGKVLARPEWPSNSRAAGIVAANNKGFVTETGGQLTLFSPELTPVKHMDLPRCAADDDHTPRGDWYPNPSWSGKYLLLVSGRAWSKSCWLWVDAENLLILGSWQDVRTGPIAVSDDRLIMKPFGRHFGDAPSGLQEAVPGGDWKAVPSTLNASAPQFVGPDLLYFHRPKTIEQPAPAEASLVRSDGSELLRVETTRKGWGPGQAAVSRAGNRFVILQGQVKGSYPAFDIGGHSVLKGLLVYDAPFRAASYTLQVRDSKVRNASAALSPDGRHLAVLGYPEPVLEVFELPPPVN